MSCYEVKESLTRLVDLTDDELLSSESLCRECFKEITAGLKADADSEDPRVTATATGLALYKLMLKRSNDLENFSSFKAGDVSISQNRSEASVQLKKAEDYFKQCFSKIVPMCQDNGFAFTNVKVKVIV